MKRAPKGRSKRRPRICSYCFFNKEEWAARSVAHSLINREFSARCGLLFNFVLEHNVMRAALNYANRAYERQLGLFLQLRQRERAAVAHC